MASMRNADKHWTGIELDEVEEGGVYEEINDKEEAYDDLESVKKIQTANTRKENKDKTKIVILVLTIVVTTLVLAQVTTGSVIYFGATGGGWTGWDDWGSCSVTCGTGFTTRIRTCSSPRPSIMGYFCDGTSVQVQTCNNTSCSATQTAVVAFTAYLSKTIANIGTHQHIVFDNVITNVGNGYSSLNGHFTAPIKGVYIFFVVLTNIPIRSASIQLLKNGQWIGHALADGTDSDGGVNLTSTLPVTAELQQGDQVWVQNEYSYSTVEELNGKSWSSFSGHLIAAN